WVVQFSPNGKQVAAKYHTAGDERNLLLLVWDVPRHKKLVERPAGQIHAPLTFSDDGAWLAAYSRNEGKLLRISTADWRVAAKQVAAPPNSVAWDRAGKRLGNSHAQQIDVRSADALQQERTCHLPTLIRGVSWSADG